MAGPGRCRTLRQTTLVPQGDPERTNSASVTSQSLPNSNDAVASDPPPRPQRRGRTRGLALNRATRGGQKIETKFVENYLRSLGPGAEHFTTELGSIVRSELSPLIRDASKILEDAWMKIYSKIEEKFQVDVHESTPRMAIYSIVTTAHKTWHYNNKKHYKYILAKYDSETRARQEPPGDVTSNDWQKLCDLYNNKEYQERCEKNSENRGHLKILHCAGSKPFVRIREEMDNADMIQIFQHTRKCKVPPGTEATWVTPEAESTYARMIDLQTQPTPEDDNLLTNDEIYDQVNGTRPRYIKGLGHGFRPSSSSTSRKLSREEQARLENQIREEAKAEQAALEARLREEAKVEQAALREEAEAAQAALEARIRDKVMEELRVENSTIDARMKAMMEDMIAQSRL